jgi:methylase of polypeptide subunit release factors
MTDVFDEWLSALEARHLADLRVAEMTRALRALSAAYVERRHTVGGGAALDSHGKRAAFALFYAPLHFLVTRHVARALDRDATAPSSIVDIGCGTGAAGAAWALEAGAVPVVGIDRHPWAVAEARWTYKQPM